MSARVQVAVGDGYIVQRELATGGMATVYVAIDTARDRTVAIKVLRPEMVRMGAQRFRHEVAVVRTLEHPCILPILDHGEHENLAWYAMPLIDGESLRERLARESRLPVALALKFAGQIASALEHSHGAGYIHRDVKPDNILVSGSSNALLADFGIARPMHDVEGKSRPNTLDVEVPTTTTGFVLGSPQYMSPEQVGGDPTLDGRTDQYSLAAVLYEMLAGEPPFGGRTAGMVVAKMFAGSAPSVRVARPEVSRDADEVIQRALSRSRSDRFPTISDFARALHLASGGATKGIGGALSAFASRLREMRSRA
jgi:eukaryotic-like serine/threonine-protein kinase